MERDALTELGLDRSLLEIAFEQAPIGLGLWDRDLRYLHLNETLARINGLPIEEHLGRRFHDLLPDLDPEVLGAFRRVLDTGEPVVNVEVGGETPAAPGTRRYWRTSYYPVRDATGEVAAVGAVVAEITEEKRLEEAQRSLERELTQEQAILGEVIERVPVGVALLWGPELRFRLVNRRFYELVPVEGDVIGKTAAEAFPDLESETRELVTPVLETGETLRLDDIAIRFKGPEGERAERYYGGSLVPIPGQGEDVAGVLAVFLETTDQVRGRRELELRLEKEHEIADTLERSLLPPTLPEVEGARLIGRFIPAGPRYQVGGDFYDAFEVEDGLMLVLGDVPGKGPAAAAHTARVRHTLRSLALYEHRPARLLAQFNAKFIAEGGPPAFCTLICALVQPLSSAKRLTIASAGHPLPILVRRRRAGREVGAANPAIGVVNGQRFREKRLRLRSGDRIFLYTDGLTDAQAPGRVITSKELRGALSGRALIPLEQLADNLVGWACGPAGRDDVALLAIERR